MRFLPFLLVFFASCNDCCWAQIKVQPEYATGQPVVVEVAFADAPEGAIAHVLWTIGGDAGYLPQSPTSVCVWPRYALKDQTLKLRCSGFLTTVSKDGSEIYVKDSHREFEASTKILGIGPSPQPDPEPDPEPTPDPQPDGEAPIPEPGFRVLIVYETGDLSSMPKWVFDADVRSYLTNKCVRGPDGKTAEWRMVDPQVVTAPSSVLWAKAIARPRKELPWILISDGKHGFEGPLPKEKADALKLLQKYGGQ